MSNAKGQSAGLNTERGTRAIEVRRGGGHSENPGAHLNHLAVVPGSVPRQPLSAAGTWRAEVASADRLLRAREVADMLAVSLRGVWRLASEGHIPAPIKLGGATRWRESDLRRLLNEADGQRPAKA